MPRTKKQTDATPEETAAKVIAYKGFNADLTCTPDGKVFQYEIGATYQHDGEVKACSSGFHACEHPLDVLSYYPPTTSRFALVEMAGAISRDGGDTKIAAAEITIKAELRLPELIASAVRYVMDRIRWIDGSYAGGEREGVRSTEQGGAATASGSRGAATASGYQGAATASGDQGAATASGRWGAATASGSRGAATASGTGGAATASGYQGAATASGDWGAATASGNGGAATASGWRGAATASGDQGAATASGDLGAATASGYGGKARGKAGCALFLAERNEDGEIINVWAGIAGRDEIKPDVFYTLRNGQPVEAE